ncbi:MAG TPA: LOG family protein [Chlamydiales bacterium]|nr:LOG family protein [Chlamydiales bacterium]
METVITASHYDLVTPDGFIHSIKRKENNAIEAVVHIHQISSHFVGFQIEHSHVFFNLKSTLAQLGINAKGLEYHFEPQKHFAEVRVELTPFSQIAASLLSLLTEGAYIGKLFAADPRRRVREPDYLFRMFGRSDRQGRPLLSLGGLHGQDDIIVQKHEGRTVAFLALKNGVIEYDSSVNGILPTIAKGLKKPEFKTRELLQFHQVWKEDKVRIVEDHHMLLVKTAPLHIRTVFAKVAEELLPEGYQHTTASILQPDTMDSGDVYELFGQSLQVIDDIPLEFYTLEPHREFVFFSDRDQLQVALEQPEVLFKAFETAPEPKGHLAAAFVVKSQQLHEIKPSDWILRDPHKHELPGLDYPSRQVHILQRYLENQPCYPFLKAIEHGLITSQGVLLSRFFPSPLLKRLLLSERAQSIIKQIYFQIPSHDKGQFFSHEDRSFMFDLAKFALNVFWVDTNTRQVLRYVVKPGKDTGLFVPIPLIEDFRKSTVFGVYGSNLIEGNFETELQKLLQGIKQMKNSMAHPLLNENTPISLLTGGGPGAMEVGNRVAKKLGIVSCANIVDFRSPNGVVNEQKQNPYIDAKMTYGLDKLVERQAEFYLDFPIFLMGGIGMDFEYTLEEVRRKVGAAPLTPIMLFGSKEYWQSKISSRFRCNLQTGTIKGSEWVSNCFFCIQKAEQGLQVFRKFFQGTLPIGKQGPIYEDGFLTVPENWE